MDRSKGQRGFSLVELMVVVAIIGILSAIAIPKFRVFQAKARQAEAKSNLASIHTLEQAYQAENDTYVAMPAQGAAATGTCNTANVIGFVLTNCTATGANGPRYTYSVVMGSPTTGATGFTATAISGAGTANRVSPGCAADTWTMDDTKLLKAVFDSVTQC